MSKARAEASRADTKSFSACVTLSRAFATSSACCVAASACDFSAPDRASARFFSALAILAASPSSRALAISASASATCFAACSEACGPPADNSASSRRASARASSFSRIVASRSACSSRDFNSDSSASRSVFVTVAEFSRPNSPAISPISPANDREEMPSNVYGLAAFDRNASVAATCFDNASVCA